MAKNLHAIQETWVQSLGWEDPLEEGMTVHSSILAWRIFMDRGALQAMVHRVTQNQMQLKRLCWGAPPIHDPASALVELQPVIQESLASRWLWV